MPERIESNGKTYLIYNFYIPTKSFPHFERTKDLFLKAKDKPIVVIDCSFEGNCFLESREGLEFSFPFLAGWGIYWNKLHSILREYDLDKIVLLYGDANIEQNYINWCEFNKEERVFGKCIYRPQTLLFRSLYQHKKVRMQPNESFKPKHFICLNGSSKSHRFYMVESLFANGWNSKGYISYLNRYGVVNKCKPTENFQGQNIHLDFNSGEIQQDANQEVIPTQYREACFDIVTESIKSDIALFITEKTWKPILQKTPFIILGSKNSHKHLEEYFGIKPYTDLFDYRFDNLDYDERFDRLKEDNLKRLLNMDIHELNEIVNSDKMQKLLEYNKAQLLACLTLLHDIDDIPLNIPDYGVFVDKSLNI